MRKVAYVNLAGWDSGSPTMHHALVVRKSGVGAVSGAQLVDRCGLGKREDLSPSVQAACGSVPCPYLCLQGDGGWWTRNPKRRS